MSAHQSRITHLEVRATTDTGQVIAYDSTLSPPAQWFHDSGMAMTLSTLTDELRADCWEQGLL